MEDFVTFDLAKKLKEKGFKETCFGWYYPREICGYDYRTLIVSNCSEYRGDKYKDLLISHNDDKHIDAPTISQVLKWLREEKDIDLVISPVFFYDDVLGKMREYGCKVFAPLLNKPEHCSYHEEWEQAAIAGIEYVIDNLI